MLIFYQFFDVLCLITIFVWYFFYFLFAVFALLKVKNKVYFLTVGDLKKSI